MRTTVTVPEELLRRAVDITQAKSQSDAVRKSLEELVARYQVKQFLDECGTFGFEYDWSKQRELDALSSR